MQQVLRQLHRLVLQLGTADLEFEELYVGGEDLDDPCQVEILDRIGRDRGFDRPDLRRRHNARRELRNRTGSWLANPVSLRRSRGRIEQIHLLGRGQHRRDEEADLLRRGAHRIRLRVVSLGVLYQQRWKDEDEAIFVHDRERDPQTAGIADGYAVRAKLRDQLHDAIAERQGGLRYVEQNSDCGVPEPRAGVDQRTGEFERRPWRGIDDPAPSARMAAASDSCDSARKVREPLTVIKPNLARVG